MESSFMYLSGQSLSIIISVKLKKIKNKKRVKMHTKHQSLNVFLWKPLRWSLTQDQLPLVLVLNIIICIKNVIKQITRIWES